MNDKVSVIIPCYNHAHFLHEAVASVMAQTHDNWECIIVNDGSTDDTEKIGLTLCQLDRRINYIDKENGGLSSARNTGLDNSSGDYIQFMDADDIIAPEKFSLSLQAGEGADVMMSNFVFFTEEGGHKNKPDFNLDISYFNVERILSGWDTEFIFPPNTGLFKSQLFSNLRFSEKLTAREDWFMWIQIYLKDVKTIFIDEPLALYRVLPNSMSKNRALMNLNQVTVFKELYKLIPVPLHPLFFNKVINTLGECIVESDNLLSKTRASRSYRVGNFFIRNINRLKGNKNSTS